MSRVSQAYSKPFEHLKLSLFEKVILANSVMLICDAVVGIWITSHNLEAHHYLIDTSFIVLTMLLGLLVNIALIRASFRPLFGLMYTIRKVSAGDTHTRAKVAATDTEIGELAQAFNKMLDGLEQARKDQAILILQAQEEERRRLALELHDESSQNLSALLIHTEILRQSLQAVPDELAVQPFYSKISEGLQGLNCLTQKTLDSIRILAQQLRPSVLDDLGLFSALRWLAEDSRERLHLPVEVQLEDIEDIIRSQQLGDLYETTLFRIAQESLTNAARYAHPQRVWLSLSQNQQSICLQVCDDGIGFDPTQKYAGLGIAGMRERAYLLEGSLTITSQTGQGTTVEVVLPLSSSNLRDSVHAWPSYPFFNGKCAACRRSRHPTSGS